MTATVNHNHLPIYRVVRRGWPDPIETTFSQGRKADNRWNTVDFPALYCCCSEAVASAIVKDLFRIATKGDLLDLQKSRYPQLVEIEWRGESVDMISESAIVLAGFATDYPNGVNHSQTQIVAIGWHAAGALGVLCRSASMARLGFNDWSGDHEGWSELAIYTENCATKPSVLNRRDDLGWL